MPRRYYSGSRTRACNWTVDIDKCEFDVQPNTYHRFHRRGKGIRMDPEKVKAIMDWEVPRSVKGIRSFLGFANFCRRFIRDFSR
jgi:hypothetical protein